jgi:hypothetical protein
MLKETDSTSANYCQQKSQDTTISALSHVAKSSDSLNISKCHSFHKSSLKSKLEALSSFDCNLKFFNQISPMGGKIEEDVRTNHRKLSPKPNIMARLLWNH